MKILKIVVAMSAILLACQPAMAADKDRRVELPAGFVGFDMLQVPVLDDYRMHGILYARFAVQTDDADLREKFVAFEPRARDLYMRKLTEFARIWVDPARPVDVHRLAQTLQQATDEFAAKKGVKVYVLEALVKRR